MTGKLRDVIVIGGGQAGLAAGYYLRRAGLDFAMLDAEEGAGGAWRHGWDSLRLFSPSEYSSLPGWQMPPSRDLGFPTREEVVDYFERYEKRYALPAVRPIFVGNVTREQGSLRIETDGGGWTTRAVVSATGIWRAPHVPDYPGRDLFQGTQIHSASYRSPIPFTGQTVLVVGGGNSGAQILAEVSAVAETIWVTLEPPGFLPDDVDGRVLFHRASARYRGLDAVDGRSFGLASIVMVPPVREARERGALGSVRPFQRFTETGVIWGGGSETRVDAVIWCTGFRPSLDHLRGLAVVGTDGRVRVEGTRSVTEPRLWLLGYGNWTGFASATLIGAGRTARETVREIAGVLDAEHRASPVADLSEANF